MDLGEGDFENRDDFDNSNRSISWMQARVKLFNLTETAIPRRIWYLFSFCLRSK